MIACYYDLFSCRRYKSTNFFFFDYNVIGFVFLFYFSTIYFRATLRLAIMLYWKQKWKVAHGGVYTINFLQIIIFLCYM